MKFPTIFFKDGGHYPYTVIIKNGKILRVGYSGFVADNNKNIAVNYLNQNIGKSWQDVLSPKLRKKMLKHTTRELVEIARSDDSIYGYEVPFGKIPDIILRSLQNKIYEKENA